MNSWQYGYFGVCADLHTHAVRIHLLKNCFVSVSVCRSTHPCRCGNDFGTAVSAVDWAH